MPCSGVWMSCDNPLERCPVPVSGEGLKVGGAWSLDAWGGCGMGGVESKLDVTGSWGGSTWRGCEMGGVWSLGPTWRGRKMGVVGVPTWRGHEMGGAPPPLGHTVPGDLVKSIVSGPCGVGESRDLLAPLGGG